MKPPKRLCDDPAAPGELRADLARVQSVTRNYDAIGKLSGLRAALENDASTQAAESTRASGSGQALETTRTTLWQFQTWPWAGKLALLSALGGVVGTAIWFATMPVQPLPAEGRTPRVTSSETSSTEPPVPPTETALQAPSPAQRIEAARPTAVVRDKERASRREVDQLAQIRASLERDPASAYRMAKQSELEFSDGALGEEREALSLLALAKLGKREEARKQARTFLARHPESPMGNVVRALLER